MFNIVNTTTGLLRVDYTIACIVDDSQGSHRLFTLAVVGEDGSILKVPGRWFLWELKMFTNIMVVM